MTKQERDELKKSIANNKIEQAIEKLLQFNLAEDDCNEVMATLARYKQLQKEIRGGVISKENQQLQSNQITNSLLYLIDEIDASPKVKKESNALKRKPVKGNRNRWIVILGILGSIASIISLWQVFAPDKNETKVEQLTVFVTDAEGNAVLKYKGELNIPIGNRILNRPIEANGRTNFADITSDNIGDSITIGLKAKGWEIDGTNQFLFTGKPIKLKVKRDDSLGTIKGSVMTRDGQNFIDSARITINADTTIYSNENGLFEIILPENMRIENDIERYRLTISKEGYETATEHYQVRSTDAEIRLTKTK